MELIRIFFLSIIIQWIHHLLQGRVIWIGSSVDIHHLKIKHQCAKEENWPFFGLFCFSVSPKSSSHTTSCLSSWTLGLVVIFLPCNCAVVRRGGTELTICWRYLYPEAGSSVFFWCFFHSPFVYYKGLGREETLKKGDEREAARSDVRSIRN